MSTEPDLKYCSNCKKDDIPAGNFSMHELHCRRNIVLCSRCDEPVPVGLLEEHNLSEHAQEACDKCKQSIERRDIERHQAEQCPKREKQCSYCDISYPACDFVEHAEQCGSRTESCEKCKKRICLRDLAAHAGSSECASELSKKTLREKVCDYCGSSVTVAEYSQHVIFCGDTKVYCDTCRQQVLLRNMAQHLGSGCVRLVVGVDGTPTFGHIDSFRFRESINGVALSDDDDDMDQELGLLEHQMNNMSPFFRKETVPTRVVPLRFDSGVVSTARDNRTHTDEPSSSHVHNYQGDWLRPVKPPQVEQIHLSDEPTRNLPAHVGSRNIVAAGLQNSRPQDPVSRDVSHSFRTSTVSSLPLREIPVKRAPRVMPPSFLVPTEASKAQSELNTKPDISQPPAIRVRPGIRSQVIAKQLQPATTIRSLTEQTASPANQVYTSEQHAPGAGLPAAIRGQTMGAELPATTLDSRESPSATPDNSESTRACGRCRELFPLDALPDHEVFCGVLDEHGEHVLAKAFKKGSAGSFQPHFHSSQEPTDLSEAGDSISSDRDYGPVGRDLSGATSMLLPSDEDRPWINQEPDLLPCQLCQELIPAERLADHEDACYGSGDAVVFDQPMRNRRPAVDRLHDDRGISSLVSSNAPDGLNASQEVEIPCQFCEKLFAADILYSHQALCPRRQDLNPVGDFQHSRLPRYSELEGDRDGSMPGIRTRSDWYTQPRLAAGFDRPPTHSRRPISCELCGSVVSENRRMAGENLCQRCAADPFTTMAEPAYRRDFAGHSRVVPMRMTPDVYGGLRSGNRVTHPSAGRFGPSDDFFANRTVYCHYCDQHYPVVDNHEAVCPNR